MIKSFKFLPIPDSGFIRMFLVDNGHIGVKLNVVSIGILENDKGIIPWSVTTWTTINFYAPFQKHFCYLHYLVYAFYTIREMFQAGYNWRIFQCNAWQLDQPEVMVICSSPHKDHSVINPVGNFKTDDVFIEPHRFMYVPYFQNEVANVSRQSI